MVAVAKPPVRMTVEEFLRWDSGDDRRYELVDGAPRAMAPAGPLHGFLQAEFAAIVRNHLRAQGSGYKAIVAPGVVPKRFFRHNARVPDLAVTCAPILPGQTTLPDPVLLVEILSPGNQAKTRTNVWAYTSIPCVLDILILHTDRIAADLLRRAPGGEWPDEATRIAGDVVELESIGLRLALSELYAGTGLSA